MKKRITFVAFAMIAVAAIILVYLAAGSSLFNFKQYPTEKTAYISTHWQQMGGFEMGTPDRMRLGCWSTALAQIARFHRLRPFGQVQYTSTKGYRVHERFDSSRYDFSLLTNQIDSATPGNEREALAAYNYAAAVIIKKDFGAGSYMQLLASPGQLEDHYRVDAGRYISWRGIFPCTAGKLFKIVQEEILAGRPLLFHFADLASFGHAVVVDGYKVTDGKQWVHLNQGQGGLQDGWYDFNADILAPGDRKLRVLYTFRPTP